MEHLHLNCSNQNSGKMKVYTRQVNFLLLVMFICATGNAQLKTLGIKNTADLFSFFHYTGNGKQIISGHRGSHIAGYPENAIETFAYVLKHAPAFFEIDPRLTKDSVIVLLHDDTLDRTTTGKGKLSS